MRKPEISLEGKVALITGAGGGIGQAVVQLMGAAGSKLYLNGVNSSKLDKLSALLHQEGVQNRWKAPDIKRSGAAEDLIHPVLDEMEGLDILVNSAGTGCTDLCLRM